MHDVGNERRFVFLIPGADRARAASCSVARSVLPARSRRVRAARQLRAGCCRSCSTAPTSSSGPIARLPFLYEVRRGSVRLRGRLAAAGAAGLLVAAWPRLPAAADRGILAGAAAAVGSAAALVAAGNLVQFAQWAPAAPIRTTRRRSRSGGSCRPGTLVQGKLANGLALENRIRPLFIGHEFGNYDDRQQRDDVRYILTYTAPELGYEGIQIVGRARRLSADGASS